MNKQKLKRNTPQYILMYYFLEGRKKRKIHEFAFFMIYHPLDTASTTHAAEASTSLVQQCKVENSHEQLKPTFTVSKSPALDASNNR